MANRAGWVHKLFWANPYTSPPNGLPRVLAEFGEDPPTMAQRLAVYPDYALGCGYSVGISFPWIPAKKRDPETNKRANERRKATLEANRIRQKLPLLADVLISENRLDWKQEERISKLTIENTGKPFRLPVARNWSGDLLSLGGDRHNRIAP
jgi:hypothetical protein